MSKERLSKLQKDILSVIYKEGKTTDKDIESVSKKDEKKITELEKQGYQPGGIVGVIGEIDDPFITGNAIYTKEVTIYELTRAAILFKIYRWEEYNAYVEGYYGFGRWRGRPDDYDKKQVTLTKTLQNLCGKRLVDLRSCWYGFVSVYNKKLAEKLGIEPSDFESKKRESLARNKQKYLKEKKENPRIGTFDEWFNETIMSIGGGRTTRRAISESWNNTRVGRNTRVVRLTENGVQKAK